MRYLKTYAALLPIFLALDFLWLGVIMQHFYVSSLGALARAAGGMMAPVIWAAAIVYLLIPLGIVALVVPRTDQKNPPLSGAAWGALYGFVLYGVYDFTNYSLIAGYPLAMTFVDVAWGTALNATCGAAAAFFFHRLK